jgi:hypothetical protein
MRAIRTGAMALHATALVACAAAAGASSLGPQAAVSGLPPAADVLAEGTCHACHATSAQNPDALGRVTLEGLPERWAPGQRYPLVLRVTHPAADRVRWGFQLTVVDAGSLHGAGELAVVDPVSTQLVEGFVAEREYLEHTEAGTGTGTRGGMAWRFEWVAAERGGTVAFFAAVNAANGDGAKEGDWIFSPSPDALATLPGPGPGSAPREAR